MTQRFPRKLLIAATVATTSLVVSSAAANPDAPPSAAPRPAGEIVAQPDAPGPRIAALAPVVRAARSLMVRALLRPSAAVAQFAIERPLLAADGRPACSNFGGKSMPKTTGGC